MKRPPEDLKLVIFDLDGTLVDAYQAICDSINHMMDVMGRPRQSLRAVKRAVGWGVDGLISNFIEPARRAEALAIFRKHHDKRLRGKLRLLPGVKRVLALLRKRGYRMAIASNRPTKFCRIILKALDIDSYFDQVVCGDAVKRPKPYPDILLRILKVARARPGQAVYVGDMTVDVLCGRRAKVFMVAVPTGSCTLAELKSARPGRIIRKLSQLPRVIGARVIGA